MSMILFPHRIRRPYKRSAIWRLDAMDALRHSSFPGWDEGTKLNQQPHDQERVDMLRAAVVRLRAACARPFATSDDREALAALEEIAHVNGILLPPIDGGCWVFPSAMPTSAGDVMSCNMEVQVS